MAKFNTSSTDPWMGTRVHIKTGNTRERQPVGTSGGHERLLWSLIGCMSSIHEYYICTYVCTCARAWTSSPTAPHGSGVWVSTHCHGWCHGHAWARGGVCVWMCARSTHEKLVSLGPQALVHLGWKNKGAHRGGVIRRCIGATLCKPSREGLCGESASWSMRV
jgi:hypothetical protein